MMMNKEICGILEVKLWLWWCNGGEHEKGEALMLPSIQLTNRDSDTRVLLGFRDRLPQALPFTI